MGFFKWGRKQAAQVIEEKSFTLPGTYAAGYRLGWYQFSASIAMLYYAKTAPLATGVDLIAEEVANINPVVYDGDEYITDAPIVEALKNPNPGASPDEFIQELAVFYSVNGSAYILAIGNIDRDPVELRAISPVNVSYNTASRAYTLHSANGGLEEFTMRETKNGTQWVSGPGRELVPLTAKNVNRAVTPVPPSPMSALYFELEQYNQANTHNLSTLTKGGKPGVIMTVDGMLPEDAKKALTREIEKFYGGAENAGRALVLPKGNTVNEVGMSAKDMDFRELRKDMAHEIYNRLRVPIPLVSSERMTLSNFAEAKFQLYDNAVLPLIGALYARIQKKLGWRYGMEPGEELTYDPASISALQTRRFEEAKLLVSLGATTTNENRAVIGYEAIGKEGDVILAPGTLVPIGTDQDTTSNRDEPAGKSYFDQALEGKIDKASADDLWRDENPNT